MTPEFLPEARDEFWEAALYYEEQEAGLGLRFRNEVFYVIQRIVADPARLNLCWRLVLGAFLHPW
jgi:hypothetical protein